MLIPSTLIELMCRSPDSRSLAKASLQNRKESKCFIRNASEICPISPMKHVRIQKLKCYQAQENGLTVNMETTLQSPLEQLVPSCCQSCLCQSTGHRVPSAEPFEIGHWTYVSSHPLQRHCPSPREQAELSLPGQHRHSPVARRRDQV